MERMFFSRKKTKKVNLPVAVPEETSSAPAAEASSQERNYGDAAEQFAHSPAEDGRLKNYAIYYRDRDVALSKGDPMIMMIQAYSHAEAQLEALKMQKEGCEILTIQSNEKVEHPTQDAVVAPPVRKVMGSGNSNSSGTGSVFRVKHNFLRGI